MADIDLIPASYRRERRSGAWLKRALTLYALMLVGIGTAKAFLLHHLDARRTEIAQLEAERSQSFQRVALLEELEAKKAALQTRLGAFERLRGGVSTGVIFQAIDRSLNDEIGFSRWEFFRAAESMGSPAARRAHLTAAESASEHDDLDGHTQTHTAIQAHAKDHTALARFVKRLEGQRAIQDIKILNTRANGQDAQPVVDFELLIRIKDRWAG
ncbi:MAG: hypothetical protein ACFCVA_05810 [Gammaproteobacteria bacterium]